uniref:Uncharacterized protein n=1 Tax=Anguilla anguilla TaxID=7936 RepID=A0A0E9PK17_ANGAN
MSLIASLITETKSVWPCLILIINGKHVST